MTNEEQAYQNQLAEQMTFVTIFLLQKSLETHLSGVEFYVVYRTNKRCSLIKIRDNEKLIRLDDDHDNFSRW
jgi:hypothetical protein